MHASLLHRSKLQLGLTITGKNQLHISHDELVKREKEGDSIFRRLHPAAYTVQKSVHTGTVYCTYKDLSGNTASETCENL